MRIFNLKDSRNGKLEALKEVKVNLMEQRSFSVGDVAFYFKGEKGTLTQLCVDADFLPYILGKKNILNEPYYVVNNTLQVITAAICGKPVLVYVGEDTNDQISFWVNFEKNKIKFKV